MFIILSLHGCIGKYFVGLGLAGCRFRCPRVRNRLNAALAVQQGGYAGDFEDEKKEW